jgi:hypothetical protein
MNTHRIGTANREGFSVPQFIRHLNPYMCDEIRRILLVLIHLRHQNCDFDYLAVWRHLPLFASHKATPRFLFSYNFNDFSILTRLNR